MSGCLSKIIPDKDENENEKKVDPAPTVTYW